MLKSIEIKNFESHKHTFLEFDGGVNIIVGLSDAGKSAIMRALRWVIWNRPTGDGFRSDWGGDTEVTVTLDDETVVSRIRSKKINQYQINGQELDFDSSSRTDVPEEVTKALNIDNINFKTQADDNFLIKNTPGEVAQHFNKIARIEKINSSLSNVDSWIRQIKQDIKSDEAEIERKNEELTKYEHLHKFESQVEVLEDVKNRISQIKNKRDSLANLLEQYNTIRKRIESEYEVLRTKEQVDSLLDISTRIEKVNKEKKQLQQHLDNLSDIRQKISEQEKITETREKTRSLIETKQELDRVKKERSGLKSMFDNLKEIRDERLQQEKKLKEHEEEFHKNIGEVCPLCGQEIKETQN